MKILIVTIVVIASAILSQITFAQDAESYKKIANQLVDLINAADYAGIENLYNKEMSTALPLNKAKSFFAGMAAQMGKIEKVDEPKRSAGWTVFPAHFERGLVDMSLALDAESKISGLYFKPHTGSTKAASKKKQDPYNKIANQLMELINAADYSGVEKLFNKDMSQALPLDKTKEFFNGLTAEVGKMQKLDAPKRTSEGRVYAVHCDQGVLDMTLALDDENKIAGLLFKPHAPSSENAPKKNTTELSLPFKGKWLVFWGGDTGKLNHHHDVPAQKFAFDILGVDEKGETHHGDGRKNEDYVCFGREILAPADGVVVEAIDGVRDNTPGALNPYCLVGNCVVIQHSTNEFSVLAHFQSGTVAVKAGDHVKRGQLLGKCGNSGNSSEPHLHYHLQHSAIFQDAVGIKCHFDKVALAGAPETKTNYSPIKGDIINAE
ncbi:MAG: DUF3887 domain-containing protein [Limisphaerales bacterium]